MRLLCGGAAVATLCCGVAKAEYSETLVGSQLVVNVDKGDSKEIADAFPDGVTSFLKTGEGTLTISSANAGLSGDAEIREGIVVIKNKNALGRMSGEWDSVAKRLNYLKSGGAIIVKKDAQLQVQTGKVNQSDYAVYKRLVLNGTGPDGSGAVALKCTDVWANMDHFLAYVELGSDASVICSANTRYGLDYTDLQGHELTIQNNYQFYISESSHQSAGTIRSKIATLFISGTASFAGGATGRLIVDGNRTLNYMGATSVFPWTLEVPSGSTCSLSYSGKWTAAGKNLITGPLQIDGTLALNGSAKTSSIRFEGSAAASAETGHINVGQGRAEFSKPETLPNYAVAGYVKVNTSTGALVLPVGDGQWDAESFASAANAVAYADSNGKLLAVTDENETFVEATNISGTHLEHEGSGTFAFSGGIRDDGTSRLRNWGPGTFKVAGEKLRYLRYLDAIAGTMLFEDAGTVRDGSASSTQSWAEWKVGANGVTNDAPAKVVLKGKTVFDATVGDATGGFTVGTTAPQGAILEVRDGAALTNGFQVGSEANSKGAVHQYDGSIRLLTKDNTGKYIGYGANSYGYFGHYAGSLYFGQNLVPSYDPTSVGIVDILGGTVTGYAMSLYLSRGGWGEIYMTGGAFNLYSNNSSTQPHILGATGGTGGGGQSVLTLDGDGNPTISCPWGDWFQLCARSSDFTAIMNLNAGVVNVNKITAGESRGATARAYLNFNGGTYKQLYNGANVFGTGATALDRVTIYEGGMTIDVAYTVTIAADTPLRAPTGRGVAKIELPADFENGKYIGPPEVRISGGGGVGATAHALYDPLTMSVTNIVVTCPGWDYESAPTATICSSDRATTNECVVTLTEGEQAGGGLTIAGNNVVNMNAANTYRGDTVIASSANLNANVEGAVPADSTVFFKGSGQLVTANGVTKHRKFGVDCAAAQKSGAKVIWYQCPSGSTIELRNIDSIPEDGKSVTLAYFLGAGAVMPTPIGYDAEKYHARYVPVTVGKDKGQVLKCSVRKGLMLIVR